MVTLANKKKKNELIHKKYKQKKNYSTNVGNQVRNNHKQLI